MIPKIIHYCWFGKNEKSDIIQKCIESWHKYCPDWEIIEWNEENYDVNKTKYTKSAYEAKKWAFVSDVARLDILYEYGGIYLDTDVEIISASPFDNLLNYRNVLVFENMRAIATGLCYACEKHSDLCQRMLETYSNSDFSIETMLVNTKMDRPVIKATFPELLWNDESQEIRNSFFMSSKSYASIMKHHGTRTWCDNLPKYKVSKDTWLKRKLRNPSIFDFLEGLNNKCWLSIYTFISFDLLDMGIIYFIKLRLRKKH